MRISFSNDGTSIPPEYLRSFFLCHQARKLWHRPGLTICHGIVEQYGGYIRVGVAQARWCLHHRVAMGGSCGWHRCPSSFRLTVIIFCESRTSTVYKPVYQPVGSYRIDMLTVPEGSDTLTDCLWFDHRKRQMMRI